MISAKYGLPAGDREVENMPARLTAVPRVRPALVRGVVALGVLGLLAPAWAAHAGNTAVRTKVCKLVVDPGGDATGTGTPASAPNDANLDIVGADVATNSTTLTGVVRLASLSTSDSAAATGREYQVVFTVGTAVLAVDAVISPTGVSYAGGKGKGFVDTKKKEVRVSVPLSTFSVKIPPNTKLHNVGARTYRVLGSDAIALGNVDKADSASTYVAGWPSCVKVGA